MRLQARLNSKLTAIRELFRSPSPTSRAQASAAAPGAAAREPAAQRAPLPPHAPQQQQQAEAEAEAERQRQLTDGTIDSTDYDDEGADVAVRLVHHLAAVEIGRVPQHSDTSGPHSACQ